MNPNLTHWSNFQRCLQRHLYGSLYSRMQQLRHWSQFPIIFEWKKAMARTHSLSLSLSFLLISTTLDNCTCLWDHVCRRGRIALLQCRSLKTYSWQVWRVTEEACDILSKLACCFMRSVYSAFFFWIIIIIVKLSEQNTPRALPASQERTRRRTFRAERSPLLLPNKSETLPSPSSLLFSFSLFLPCLSPCRCLPLPPPPEAEGLGVASVSCHVASLPGMGTPAQRTAPIHFPVYTYIKFRQEI